MKNEYRHIVIVALVTACICPCANALPAADAVTAIAAVKELGGHVTTIRMLGRLRGYSVKFDQLELTEPHVQAINAMPQLMGISFYLTKNTNSALKQITKAKDIETVNLSHTDASGDGLARLTSFKRLWSLTYLGKRVGDDDMDVIAKMQGLTRLNLAGTSVTDDGIGKLRPLKNLRQLHLEETGIGDQSMKLLSSFAKLELLTIQRTKVTDKGMNALPEFPSLQTLGGTGFGDKGLAAACRCKTLKTLNVSFGQVTDKSIAVLRQAKQLEKVTLIRNQVTQQAVDELRAARPELRIHFIP